MPTPDPTPEEEAPAYTHRSIIDTWTEVFADASGLIQTEARLLRSETTDNLLFVGRQSMKLGAGVLLIFLALIFVTIAAVVALAKLLGLLLSLLAVGAACLLIGVLLMVSGRRHLKGQPLLPVRTLRRISVDLGRVAERSPLPAKDKE